MEATALSSGKRCSWCGTLNAETNVCSKCGAALSSIQPQIVTASTATPVEPSAIPEQPKIPPTPDYGAPNAYDDPSQFERMSLDAMRSLGLGPTFVSGKTVGFLIAAGLSVYIVISLGGALLDISQLGALSKTSPGLRTTPIEFTATEAATLLIRILLIGVAMVTGVFFLIWIYRAHKNLKALGATDLKYSPGWAIGGFFIPVLNIVRPYQVVAEIWRGSGIDARRSAGAWAYESTPVFIGLWWGLWLLSGFLDSLSVVMIFGAGQTDQMMVASRSRIVYYLISIACAALAMSVVLKINARQENTNRAGQSTRSERYAVPDPAGGQL